MKVKGLAVEFKSNQPPFLNFKPQILFSIIFALWSIISNAQSGNYFLSNFTPATNNVDHVSFGIAQSDKGVLYFATKNGVIEFDGKNWSLIPTSGAVFTVFSYGNDILLGGVKGIGKLSWDQGKHHVYKSISEKHPEAINIFASTFYKDKAYFINDQELFVVSLSNLEIVTQIKSRETHESFTGLFQIAGTIFVNTAQGLRKLENDKLVTSSLALPGSELVHLAVTLKNTDKTLLVGVNDNLYLLNGENNLVPIKPTDASYLESNVMLNATWVTENLIAFGTLKGGVFFLNPTNGKTEEITNYYTGLPDNEVYAIHCDNDLGVWAAHDYGFSRIAPFLPFRSFNHYPGLDGNLLTARSFNGQIYVGTTLGLFKLTKEDVFEEQVYYQLKQSKENRSAAEPIVQKETSKRGGLFSFLKRNKKVEAAKLADNFNVTKTPEPQKLERKTRRVLKNTQYAFKRLEGIEGKINQLMEVKGKLMATGLAGIYEIDAGKAKAVLNDPVLSVELSPTLDLLIAGTINENVKTFSATKSGWEETHVLDSIHDYVSYIFDDNQENIWLCSRSGTYKIETVDKEITDIAFIPLNNPALDETVGLAYGNEVYIAASGVFNRYDVIKNTLSQYDSLPGLKKYFASAGYFWFYDGHAWRTVDPRIEKSFQMQWLGLFSNIQSISTAEKEGLWIVTSSNELYQFSNTKTIPQTVGYPLFLREVRGDQRKIEPTKTLKISQLENTVEFEFIQPDYVGMRAVEYRYLVDGLNKKWSSWAKTNNIVNFSYLPVGTYKVQVQTRDLMGKVSDIEEIRLEIEPPYWKQTWFYALEVLFFGSLVFLSIRLSKANAKYRLLSRLLSMLTIIMLIQLVDNIVASQISISNGPVVDFFIQVVIAMLMLPVEGFLRKVITKGQAMTS
jgi:hypothetical protein